jgi:hypothetical protein
MVHAPSILNNLVSSAENLIFSPIVIQAALIAPRRLIHSKLQTCVKPQSHTSINPLLRLAPWHRTCPYDICVIIIYSLLVFP